ncbi:MAG: prolipoprotein diacylglyceryl transferase [Clostridia bacterium]|nr:prolipoprotein diacylglyceryl transferase [Clostridia bacterium]
MFALAEDAPQTVFLGVRVYAWGLYCFFGAVLCLLAVMFHSRGKMKKGTAALYGVLALPMALILSRLLYCLFDARMRVFEELFDGSVGWDEYFADVFGATLGGFSMFGALLGGVLAALLCAGILKEDRRALLDAAACALLLFIAAERLGEGRLEDFGVSRPLNERTSWWGLFITHGEYDDCISTYMLESLTALAIFVLLEWRRPRLKRGDVFLTGALVFGLSQVLMESLRFDQHMRFSFVSVQQLFAMGCAVYALCVWAVRLRKRGVPSRLPLAAAAAVPAVIGLIILLEFMIDRSGISRLLLYMAYIALLSCPLVIGLRMRNALAKADPEGT